MGENEHCLEHSGFDARITQCEKNDVDIFTRLHGIEKTVWMAAGSSGVICGIITSIVVTWVGRH